MEKREQMWEWDDERKGKGILECPGRGKKRERLEKGFC